MISNRFVCFAARASLILVVCTGSAALAQLPRKPASGAVGTLDRNPAPTATTKAPTQVRELYCRGGSGLQFRVHQTPSPRQQLYVTMALRYRRSRPAPAGTDFRMRLDPGSCSWNAPAGPIEPGEVFFDTYANAQAGQVRQGVPVDRSPAAAATYPDKDSIPLYMKDSRHFWIFYVNGTGEQLAISHGAWQANTKDQAVGPGLTAEKLPTIREGAVDVSRPVDQRLPTSREKPVPLGASRAGGAVPPVTTDITSRWAVHNVRVTPGRLDVAIRFMAGPTRPTVQISSDPPIQEPSTGRWFFLKPQPARVAGGQKGSGWEYHASQSAPLEGNTAYHYLIDVPRDGSVTAEQQQVGTFRTLGQTAKVWFRKLHMIDDSDEASSGDLQFAFTVNENGAQRLGSRLSPLQRETGSTLWLRMKTIVVENAPNLLRIHVAGLDNDAELPGDNHLIEDRWNATPGGDRGGDWNFARGEYLLDQYPRHSFTFPFTLRSLPGSKLQFEVTGEVEVVRQ